MNKFLKLYKRKKIIIMIAIQDKFIPKKCSTCIKFHQELKLMNHDIGDMG